MSSPSILIVDDDPSARSYAAMALSEHEYLVRTAGNGVEALLAIEARAPDLVISDLHMPVMDGLEFLRHLKQRWPDVATVVLTVSEDVRDVVTAVQLGAVDYLVKPASPAALLSLVRRTLALAPPTTARDDSVASEIVGGSPAAVEVRHLVALAARCEVNVLITGRTGTGKELVARAIHRASRLAAGPFIAHNCAATPLQLFESQFFGHRRGAFTGADRDQPGLMELADQGMLFLDELESMELAHQAKLLRVLDDGEFRPVGSPGSRRVAVRILAATNGDPLDAIADKSLRDDLYYRLRGIEIRLPPLAERPEDIPLLAAHFLGPASRQLTPEALKALAGYPWPGNVRELRNVLRAALARAKDGPIVECCLGLASYSLGARSDATLKEVESEAIRTAIGKNKGNRSRAARALGIDRSTLRRKLKDLGPPQ